MHQQQQSTIKTMKEGFARTKAVTSQLFANLLEREGECLEVLAASVEKSLPQAEAKCSLIQAVDIEMDFTQEGQLILARSESKKEVKQYLQIDGSLADCAFVLSQAQILEFGSVANKYFDAVLDFYAGRSRNLQLLQNFVTELVEIKEQVIAVQSKTTKTFVSEFQDQLSKNAMKIVQQFVEWIINLQNCLTHNKNVLAAKLTGLQLVLKEVASLEKGYSNLVQKKFK